MPGLPPRPGIFFRRWSCSGKKLAALPNRKQGMPAFWEADIHPCREEMRNLCS